MFMHVVRFGGDVRSWAVERVCFPAALARWALLLAGVWATLVVWAGPDVQGNLARRASVTMSSTCDTPPIFSRFPPEPSRLVDGKIDRAYDACTAKDQPISWVQLDLGISATIDEVVVTGRADCCWGVDTLPLVLEVAADGAEYREMERRTLPFTRDDPWRVALAQQLARRIRLRVEQPGARASIVLTEIEVYGKPIALAPM